jgi:hypothetical protein
MLQWAYPLHHQPSALTHLILIKEELEDEMEEPKHITELKPDYKSAMDIRGTPTTSMPMR